MAKQGEIEYLQHLAEDEIHHAVGKPFTDANCGGYLAEIGCIMSLLPGSGRLLDVGCGTGWTSVLFAKRGYNVVGVDISDDMIFHANANKFRERIDNLSFAVCDYETMPFEREFDSAVFYDSLHHAVDERQALTAVYRALKPGGVCITSEPGTGHSTSPEAVEAVRKYKVTERDMPPQHIIRVAREVGFRSFMIYPHATNLHRLSYYNGRGKTFLGRVARAIPLVRRAWSLCGIIALSMVLKHRGLVTMIK